MPKSTTKKTAPAKTSIQSSTRPRTLDQVLSADRTDRTEDAKVMRNRYDIMFAFGDRHAPHHCAWLDRIILELVKDIKPDIILDGGDWISADCLSNFTKSYEQLVGLKDEINLDVEWRKKINMVCPSARKIMLEDNHFVRRLKDRINAVDNLWMDELMDAESLLRGLRYAVERKLVQERLDYLATHDGVTGLPNRQTFLGQLSATLAQCQRRGGGACLGRTRRTGANDVVADHQRERPKDIAILELSHGDHIYVHRA